jgi:hypothetical protein
VPAVRVLNPRNRRAWVHTAQGVRESRDGMLASPGFIADRADLFGFAAGREVA